MAKNPTTCMDDFDPSSLSLAEAINYLQQHISPIQGSEEVSLEHALHRVVAEEVLSPINVPPFNNAAMDGYAFHSSSLENYDRGELIIAGKALAGAPYLKKVKTGECIRIMTGAMIPEGVDTVVMQEYCEATQETCRLTRPYSAGENIRQAGEDVKSEQSLFDRGERLTAAHLGILASVGISQLKVCRKIRVALFSTGDELVQAGESLTPGKIYDSNRFALMGQLQQHQVEIIDLGVIPDDQVKIREALIAASTSADVIITSGGVSVGEADFIKSTLEEIGQINFWKLAIKPGRPLAFGKIANTLFFGLPGNPVSSMVTFSQIVSPALRYLQGEAWSDPLSIQVVCNSQLKKRAGRMEFQRGILKKRENGELSVTTTGGQGSGILSSMVQANCYIVLPMEAEEVKMGQWVTVIPFTS